MPAVKATDEFDALPVSQGQRVVAMESVNGILHILYSDGALFVRAEDRSKLNQPGGPHWTWAPLDLPKR